MRQSSSEMDLIGRMQAGDTAAVGELASMYGPRIQQLAFRYVKNWEDAEEVAQDVLLKVYRRSTPSAGTRRCLLDLPHYLQHRDVPSADRRASAADKQKGTSTLPARISTPAPSLRTGRPWRRPRAARRDAPALIGALTTCPRFTGCR